ncbi:hypothetical protein BH18ACT17_BH18ACT17_04860 [soil metagenome]
MIRRTLRLGLAVVLAASMLLGAAPAANAQLSDTPDDTWMTNGQVYAIAQSGGTIYIGGKFSSVRACPPGQSCGPGSVVNVLNLAALDAASGDAIPSFRPEIGAPGEAAFVYGAAVASGKLWVAGKFSQADGQPRLNLAAYDLATGALVPEVDHQIGTDISDRIRGIYALCDRVYVAGYFTTVDGLPRKHLAAFNLDGTLNSQWKPRTAGLARTLTQTCDGLSIIAGGSFRKASGSTGANVDRATLAIFDATTGALDPWTPDNAAIPNGVNAFDLDASCDRLFVGYGGSNALYGFDLSDDFGEVLFDVKTGGNVQTVDLSVDGTRVYFGGHFANVSVKCPGVSRNENDSRTRFAVADIDGCVREPGSPDPLDGWTPTFSGKFYGPWDIFSTGNQVYVGGQFTDVSGQAQFMIARFTDA